MAKNAQTEQIEETDEQQTDGRGRKPAPTTGPEAVTQLSRRLTSIVRQIEGLKNSVRYCAKLGVAQKRVLAVQGHLEKAAENFATVAAQVYEAPDEIVAEEIIEL